MNKNYIAVPAESVLAYYKAKREREEVFGKLNPTHDELSKAHQAMVDAAIEVAELALPQMKMYFGLFGYFGNKTITQLFVDSMWLNMLGYEEAANTIICAAAHEVSFGVS